jgi:AraC-like DNA-binding protein
MAKGKGEQIIQSTRLFVKHDFNIMCMKVMRDQLEKTGIDFELDSIGEIKITGKITDQQYALLEAALINYGIEIITDKKSLLIQKTKNAIVEMIHLEEEVGPSKISAYLASKMKLSYGHLSNLFSEVTHSSIENFIIIQKIERAKQLIISGELTLTEISFRLHYSSVAHLSNQFKKTLGMNPTTFQRIVKKRQMMNLKQGAR